MMSTQVSQKCTDVVFGYSRSFDGYISPEIINLCIAFFNVGEEFDAQMSTLPIEGANQTICRCIDSSKAGECVGYNLVSGPGNVVYHWRLHIKTLSDEPTKDADGLTFSYGVGLLDDESKEIAHGSIYLCYLNEITLDVYFGFGEIPYMAVFEDFQEIDEEDLSCININKEYRFAIGSEDAVSFEILEFHSFNLDVVDGKLEDLALALPLGTERKIWFFEQAIIVNPRSFTYVEEYIYCCLEEEEYEKAYNAVLTYYGRRYIPVKFILKILKYAYFEGYYEAAKELFELIYDELGPERIDLIADIYFAIGDIYNVLEEFDEAIKYFELSLPYNEEEFVTSFCVSQLKVLYHEVQQYEKAFNLILEHNDSELICAGYILKTADALFRNESYEEAITLFDLSKDDDKDLTDCHMSVKADAYYELRDFENAARYVALRLKNAESEDVVSFCSERLRSIYRLIDTQEPKNGERLYKCTMIVKKILEHTPDCKTEHNCTFIRKIKKSSALLQRLIGRKDRRY